MRSSVCPVCEKAIPADVVTDARAFQCPHCKEMLRALRRPGVTGGWIVHIVFLVLLFTYRIDFLKQLALAAAIGLSIGVINFALNRMIGFELEPVGRIPLGGLED